MAVDGPAGMVFPIAIFLFALGPFVLTRQWGAFILIMVALTAAGFGFWLNEADGGAAAPAPAAPVQLDRFDIAPQPR